MALGHIGAIQPQQVIVPPIGNGALINGNPAGTMLANVVDQTHELNIDKVVLPYFSSKPTDIYKGA